MTGCLLQIVETVNADLNEYSAHVSLLCFSLVCRQQHTRGVDNLPALAATRKRSQDSLGDEERSQAVACYRACTGGTCCTPEQHNRVFS